MLWRHRWQVRIWSAVGLCGCLMILGSLSAMAQLPRPDDPEAISAPDDVATETVDLLKASKAGDLSVVARGQGQDRVRLTIRNTSSKRLNVVLPAGLVASAAAGQGQGRGQGQGFQSMGLGMFSNRPGNFGQFRGHAGDEEQPSVAIASSAPLPLVTVPTGESLDVTVTAVCLNFGVPTPTVPRPIHSAGHR